MGHLIVETWQANILVKRLLLVIARNKKLFQPKSIKKVFFLFLHKNICCGYSLRMPWQEASCKCPKISNTLFDTILA